MDKYNIIDNGIRSHYRIGFCVPNITFIYIDEIYKNNIKYWINYNVSKKDIINYFKQNNLELNPSETRVFKISNIIYEDDNIDLIMESYEDIFDRYMKSYSKSELGDVIEKYIYDSIVIFLDKKLKSYNYEILREYDIKKTYNSFITEIDIGIKILDKNNNNICKYILLQIKWKYTKENSGYIASFINACNEIRNIHNIPENNNVFHKIFIAKTNFTKTATERFNNQKNSYLIINEDYKVIMTNLENIIRYIIKN